MRIIDSCAKCLYDKEIKRADNAEYLREIKELLDNRSEEDTAPYMVYLFNQIYERYFGKRSSYGEIKYKFNELVLSIEDKIKSRIEESDDTIATAMLYARIGNYIDFGAMNSVNERVFLELFEETQLSEKDKVVVESLVEKCKNAKRFLLIADNCGEIVLDKLFLEQLKKRFPDMELQVMVRGGEVLNDATMEDAIQAGIDKVATVIPNGVALAGTVYSLLSEEAKAAIDGADVILAKGQGNYESLCGQGRNIFYSFLCKCELFTSRFEVPMLTGIFVEEG